MYSVTCSIRSQLQRDQDEAIAFSQKYQFNRQLVLEPTLFENRNRVEFKKEKKKQFFAQNWFFSPSSELKVASLKMYENSIEI